MEPNYFQVPPQLIWLFKLCNMKTILQMVAQQQLELGLLCPCGFVSFPFVILSVCKLLWQTWTQKYTQQRKCSLSKGRKCWVGEGSENGPHRATEK